MGGVRIAALLVSPGVQVCTDVISLISVVWGPSQATVDVISSSGWLNPALTAMEMSQMAAQAMWDRDSHLLQLPHVSKELAAKAAAAGVETVFDLQEMEARHPHRTQPACPSS